MKFSRKAQPPHASFIILLESIFSRHHSFCTRLEWPTSYSYKQQQLLTWDSVAKLHLGLIWRSRLIQESWNTPIWKGLIRIIESNSSCNTQPQQHWLTKIFPLLWETSPDKSHRARLPTRSQHFLPQAEATTGSYGFDIQPLSKSSSEASILSGNQQLKTRL